ncbi:uracil-DNA glycosylase family protein [Rubritalea spongiae]|uniref:Type-4 uracil-DNA glycosylase n=1 Tax=Rubritalea spongiae TaxID=430797 RepID=A0ABW5E1M3_9BACT
MSAIADPVIDYLRQLERQGQTHVHLDERARLILREFYKRSKGIVDTPSTVQAAPVLRDAPVSESKPVEQKTAVNIETPVPMSKSLEGIQKQMAVDPVFKTLGSLREKMVFSEGDSTADVMLVGEAPSYHDELKGAPFSGPAGKKMEAILKAMGIARNEVYMTNMVKFRPAMPNQTTNTRKPNEKEIEASMRYLMAEVKAVQPKVIIVLGATAAKSLIGPDVPVADMLGQFHRVAGVPVRATYHPSYLLAEGVTDQKKEVWRDMLEVMELLKMPISEKQRGYFK